MLPKVSFLLKNLDIKTREKKKAIRIVLKGDWCESLCCIQTEELSSHIIPMGELPTSGNIIWNGEPIGSSN